MAAKPLLEIEVAPGRRFALVEGDLLEEPVEAIVNAANGRLEHGGGVAAAIARAAGPAFVEESRRLVRERGPIPTGEAVVTGAGCLPFKGVIHAVGPRQGEGDEEAKLVRALSAAFRCATERGWRTVAFPAVSAGIFGVPAQVCARAYLAAVRAADVSLLRLCVRDAAIAEAVRKELGPC